MTARHLACMPRHQSPVAAVTRSTSQSSIRAIRSTTPLRSSTTWSSPTFRRPVAQQSGNLLPESGSVLVRVPGSLRYVPVQALTSIPVGSIIDARNGVVLLTVSDGLGHLFTGEFRGGLFRFTQRLAKKGSKKLITDITLVGGKFKSLCDTTSTTANARAASWGDMSRRRVVR